MISFRRLPTFTASIASVALACAASADVWLSLDRNPIEVTRELVDEAETSIDVAVYKFEEGSLRKALGRALARGVRVRVVADDAEARDGDSMVEALARAGADVRLWTRGKLHAKFVIIDGTSALAGSFNWTESAQRKNVELGVTLDDEVSIKRLQQGFEKLWDAAQKLDAVDSSNASND